MSIDNPHNKYPFDNPFRMPGPVPMMTDEQYELFRAQTPGPVNVHQWMGARTEVRYIVITLIVVGFIFLVSCLIEYVRG